MPLEVHPNSTSRQARPGLWIFSGRWVALIPASVLACMCIFRMLIGLDCEWYLALAIGLLPALVSILFVLCFVNGRAPSYFVDLWLSTLWRIKSRLYMAGWLDQPPLAWRFSKTPPHPKEF